MKRLFIICLFIFSQAISSAELGPAAYWEGIKSSFTYFYEGSYSQFTAKNNLYWAAAATPSIWYSFEHDKRISANERKKHTPKFMTIASDLAPVLSFPIIPIAFYSFGIKHDDQKSMEFAKETFATMYLALLESAAISATHIHERPDQKQLSTWETAFRGASSFPSGHVVPYAAITLKTLQFYGPYYAAIPGALFVATSIQRVRGGKHYFSDVVGGFFLTAFASEGVRKAAKNQNADTAYKSIFEQDLKIGYTEFQGVIGPKISLDW